ncbi:MAG: exodeoxyribonuclease VII large subunit [Peptococcaceae bacterium]|nr:exodeoxyribonuclease VII large subunit [Peptococcaceae bacterium]
MEQIGEQIGARIGEKIWTVGDLNNVIGAVLQHQSLLHGCWVMGEISNYKHHVPSGHWYFTLKDQNAALRAVMFRSRAARVPFAPQNGMQVLVRGDVRLYEKEGSVQLYVEEMSPRGAGELYLAFERLKARLASEGLGDAARKRRIPAYPSCVGIVTSPTGAAVHDIVRVAHRRNPSVRLVLIPAAVQGGQAPQELVGALERAGRWGMCDVIILGRGGGSLEELWAFNTEEVARAVAVCPAPVISAVGHEIDFTITDFVADLRAPTPSAAAEMAVPVAEEVLGGIRDTGRRLKKAMEEILRRKGCELESMAQHPGLKDPYWSLGKRAQALANLEERLLFLRTGLMSKKNDILHLLSSRLHALSPLSILSRGYSVVQDGEGRVISGVTEVAPGMAVDVRLADGCLGCEVVSIDTCKQSPIES